VSTSFNGKPKAPVPPGDGAANDHHELSLCPVAGDLCRGRAPDREPCWIGWHARCTL